MSEALEFLPTLSVFSSKTKQEPRKMKKYCHEGNLVGLVVQAATEVSQWQADTEGDLLLGQRVVMAIGLFD